MTFQEAAEDEASTLRESAKSYPWKQVAQLIKALTKSNNDIKYIEFL